MPVKYLILIILWTSWCCMHSLMISQKVTDYIKYRFKDLFKYYRVFFNLTSLISIIPVLIYTYSIQTKPIFAWDGYFKIIQTAFLISAGYLCFTGAKQYNLNHFLGIAQIKESSSNALMTENNRIKISGIHKIIRHPWYTAAFLLIWSKSMDISGLIVNVILSLYLIAGTILEEKKLVRIIGKDYQEYQKEVDKFLPVKWIAGKISRG